MAIYFSSDYHFFHDRDFCYAKRGFRDVEEMNNIIIAHHNSVVMPDDDVYLLGDLAFGDIDDAKRYIERLNGKLHLAIGNHCTDKKIEMYKTCHNVVEVQFGYRIKASKYKTFLCTHYPTLTDNYKENGKVWNIHGHTHSTEKFNPEYPYMYNVCVDAHNCYPVSLETILDDINTKKQLKNK